VPGPIRQLAPYAVGCGWLGYFTALQWSVVRYRLGIVVVLTSAAVLLAAGLARRWRPQIESDGALGGLLVAVAAVTELVPFFSHAAPADRRLLAHLMAGTAVCAAACLLAGSASLTRPGGRSPGMTALRWPGGRWPRGRVCAALVTAVGLVSWSVAAIRLVPSPRIDVWVILQQAADGMAEGQNPYTMTWQGSPGIKDSFTYLPWTAVMLAPGRWLAGDVRWALLGLTLVGLVCLVALGGGWPAGSAESPDPARRARALGAAVLLATAPGSITQAEQAWTEPLLFACLAAWALLLSRDRAWLAVLPLAVGCASKQHLALLLPVLACWAGFGWRRAVATGGAAGLLVLPWFLADPAAFWHDTVSLLVSFHPIRFADTWFIAAQTELGRTPPFWLTGLVVLSAVAAACLAVRRRRPGLTELLCWLALVLLIANLVNKQAFYNQFWLVGALLALAVAAQGAQLSPRVTSWPASMAISRVARSSHRH
jgi:hypothetical protein